MEAAFNASQRAGSRGGICSLVPRESLPVMDDVGRANSKISIHDNRQEREQLSRTAPPFKSVRLFYRDPGTLITRCNNISRRKARLFRLSVHRPHQNVVSFEHLRKIGTVDRSRVGRSCLSRRASRRFFKKTGKTSRGARLTKMSRSDRRAVPGGRGRRIN